MRRRLKHALDRVVGCLGFVALAPLLVVTALALQLDGVKPVVVRRMRYGERGRAFGLLTFNLPASALRRRRWRLAEAWGLTALPQLANLARGELSLVGPRPRWDAEELLSVRPGLTGPAQAELQRHPLCERDVARLDAGYVDAWSLRLDARIVARTVWRAVVPQRS